MTNEINNCQNNKLAKIITTYKYFMKILGKL